MRLPYAFIVVVLLVGVWGSSQAFACGRPQDGRQFRRDFSERMRCESGVVLDDIGDCRKVGAVCSGRLDSFAEVLAGASSDRGCQRELHRQSTRYVSWRVRELQRGRRGASRAKRMVEAIESACRGRSLSLGGACSGYDDPEEGALCVRALAEALSQESIGVEIRPNFLLILTDDQRWDTLWAMPRLRSLVVDRGLDFTNSFTSTSLCCPDRASIFTGLYARHHGVTTNRGAFDFDHDGDTIQRRLQERAGYRTALVGKYMVNTSWALGVSVPPGWDEWHVFFDNGGTGRTHGLYYNYRLNTNGDLQTYAPLDTWGEPTKRWEYSTDLLRDRTLGLIDAWREEPFFIEYAPFAPHTVAYPADRHEGMFSQLAEPRPPSYLEPDLSGKPDWVSDARALSRLRREPLKTHLRRIRMMETLPAVDEAIAALSSRLEEAGLTDNTMVIFTSDNGFMYLEHWLVLKSYPYEESIRVPLAIRYPARYPEARVISEFVQPIDFYPTFADLARVSSLPVDGRSLKPLLDGNATGWRQEILIEHFGVAFADPSVGIRTHDWKMIRTDASSGVTLELYDMKSDPFEMHNVASLAANRGILADLERRLESLGRR